MPICIKLFLINLVLDKSNLWIYGGGRLTEYYEENSNNYTL